MENSMESPQKIKNRITIWSSNLTSGYLSEIKNTNAERYLESYVPGSIVYNSQAMKATQMFINRWVDKEDIVLI